MSRYEELIAREAGKPGLRGKVNAKCISCIYDPKSGGGTWKQQTEACLVNTCPLYEVRPRSQGEK